VNHVRCIFSLILLSLLSMARVSLARDVFVNNLLGDDARDGHSRVISTSVTGGPVRTLTHALEIAIAGDRIILANNGVPYRESVTIFGGANSGGPISPFMIEGNGATLNGSVSVPSKAWENYNGDVFRFRPVHAAFGQVFLDGRPAKRRMLVRQGAIPNLEPREWCLAGGMIYFRVESDKLPDEYPLTYAAQTVGITLYQVRDVVIKDLVVEGFQLDGINAHDRATGCVLEGMIARGNGRAGIAIGGASQVTLVSCLIGDNGDAQVLTDGPSKTLLQSCRLLDNTAPPLVKRGGEVTVDDGPDEDHPDPAAAN